MFNSVLQISDYKYFDQICSFICLSHDFLQSSGLDINKVIKF